MAHASSPPDGHGSAGAGTKSLIALLPTADEAAVRRVEAAGALVVELDQADALVWTTPDPSGFPSPLPDRIRWVQLPSAGVERWIASGIVDDKRRWTSAAGAYALPVAEHAAMLLLAGVHRLKACVTTTSWEHDALWPGIGVLTGSTVAIVGCGSIGQALVPILRAMGCDIIAVNRSGRQVDGASEIVPSTQTAHVWGRADHFVIAAPATKDTHHLVGASELAQMQRHSWIVNVARGSLVDTEALVTALDEERIGGAALDVTDPEPLPDDHALWSHPRAIVTPHVGNPPQSLEAGLNQRLTDNIDRFARGEELAGVIDVKAGY